MKAYTLVIALSILVIGHDVRAQTPDPLSFFPHHQGDIWEYWNPQYPQWYQQTHITTDSLGTDGRYYVYFTSGGWMRIDTTTFEVYALGNPGEEGVLYYKLDANVGESWTIYRDTYSTIQARVIAIYGSSFFGVPSVVKVIEWVDSASQLQLLTKYLATGFGFVRQDIDGSLDFQIRGALINGIQYGTITASAQEASAEFPEIIVLHQNYPNPFNPKTTIVYEVKSRESVSLRVVDVLGREVATLVNEVREPGMHETEWDAGDLASGVYFYQLKAGEFTSTKKLLLLR